MTDSTDNARGPERENQALIDYLCHEAEHEIECAGELTDLGKELRRHEVTARRLVRENCELRATLATALHALVVWDAAYRTGRNEPLVTAFETGVEALSKSRAALMALAAEKGVNLP